MPTMAVFLRPEKVIKRSAKSIIALNVLIRKQESANDFI